MKKYCKALWLMASWLFFSFDVQAGLTLASPFGDHMVIQRNMDVPIWGIAGAGESVSVELGKQRVRVMAGGDGKWMLRLHPMEAGGPYELRVEGSDTVVLHDVYVGEVWLCSGQSNMDMTVAREDRYWCGVYHEQEELAAADYPMIRVFDVDFAPREEPVTVAGGKWELCSPRTVGHFSAAAYFFARELYRKYKIPVGLVTTAYGASTVEAWTSRRVLASDSLFGPLLRNYALRKAVYDTAMLAKQRYTVSFAKWRVDSAAAVIAGKDQPRAPKDPDPSKDQHSPAVLYNGMIAPLAPYGIRGVLWYQGESNTQTANIYDRQMAAMIASWREEWGRPKMAFIYVQLANYGKFRDTIAGKGGGTTWVREAQAKNLAIPGTAMVSAIDNADDAANIHPKNKQEIGRRLALCAEAIAYGEKNIYSGPLYESMKVEGSALRLKFSNAAGLVFTDGKAAGFAIAGKDRRWVWAEARIEGGTVLVSSPEVAAPVAVRYAWGDNPPISLYNGAGLPAAPFRTDVWGPDEWIDPDTHHRVVRLVRKDGDNASFYFHNNPFVGDKMVFYSRDREGRQIYTVGLHDFRISRLTDGHGPISGEIVGVKTGSVYYQIRDSVFCTGIADGRTRLVFVFPADFKGSISTLNADETLLAGVKASDEEKEILRQYPEKHQFFDRIYDAHLRHVLFTIDTRTGALKTIHEENEWLGHVQFSPVDPVLLMFCHEGPWQKVDRIWTMNVQTGAAKLMHKRTVDNEIAGHEFFAPDGRSIWFDWQIPKGQTFFLGNVDIYSGVEKRYAMTRDEWSIHFNVSSDQQLFAGDGGDAGQVAKAKDGRWIYLFRPEGDRLVSERLVNMKDQNYKLEPNVHFSPDGKWVIFRGNFEGHEDIYAVELKKS